MDIRGDRSKRNFLTVPSRCLDLSMDNVHTYPMRRIFWSEAKNGLLKNKFGGSPCFEDIVAAIEGGGLLDDIEHPNVEDYPHQRMLVVAFDGYVYAVPYVENEDGIFLKTIYPSRRLKAIYWPGEDDE
ncbi:MAG: hypothetical protein WAU86_20600 [Oricola sp.]